MNDTLLLKLQSLYTEARKSKNSVAMSCLGTMLGEIQNGIKNNPNESADEQIVKYAIKSKKNLLEYKPNGYIDELSILEDNFLPKTLSEEESKNAIINLVDSDTSKTATKNNFGYFMGLCSRQFKGQIEPMVIKKNLEQYLN